MRAASSGYSQLKGETNSKELRGQGAANTVTVLNATELFTFEWSLAGTLLVVKTLHSQCRGHGFDCWSGN